jgi:hypothetical protein
MYIKQVRAARVSTALHRDEPAWCIARIACPPVTPCAFPRAEPPYPLRGPRGAFSAARSRLVVGSADDSLVRQSYTFTPS